MSDRPVFRLGHITRDAKGLSWAPVGELIFDCRAGERIELAVTYSFEEVTKDMESFRARLEADADGRALGVIEARVKDRPMIDDSERGALVLAAFFPAGGLHNVRFGIEAEDADGPWGSAPAKTRSRIKESGRAIVRVH